MMHLTEEQKLKGRVISNIIALSIYFVVAVFFGVIFGLAFDNKKKWQ